MVFLTLAASLLVFALVLGVLLHLRRPLYRINNQNVARLLRAVAAGEARHQDWLVFTAMPIRYDPALEAIRLRCLAVEEAHLLGDQGRYLFDAQGREQLAEILRELEAQGPQA